jgi:two-component system cell cycle response regulator
MIKREKVTQPDVHVINLSALDPERGMSLLTDLKSHTKTRLAATVVLIPKDYQNLAAYVLDIGANDVMIEPIDTDELNIRLVRLIERKRIGDQLRTNIRSGLKAAITDPLTGLYNRRYAIPHMERMLMQAQENGRSCAIMVADLDHLKQINDQYGHAAGDTVLVEVSRRLNTNLRAIDLVARMGGEEFLIIMPETKQGEAETAGKRLCNLIHDTPIELANGKCQVSVSISIGVALGGGSNDPRQSAAQVLDLADRALYGSKSEGRNRVTLTDHAA